MPYKSEAQRKKLHVLANQGKIPQTTVAEFDKASKGVSLPERVAPKVRKAGTKTPAVPKVKTPKIY